MAIWRFPQIATRKWWKMISDRNLTTKNTKLVFTAPIIAGIKRNNVTHDNIMTLEQALLIAQRIHAVIIPRGSSLIIWCPGGRVPGVVRTTIWTNRKTVLRLIGQSHVLTCPSPELHRHSWSYEVKRDCCNICARINHYMSTSRSKDAA